MGRQFSFFLGPNDFAPFQEVLSNAADIIFLHDRPMRSEPQELGCLSRSDFRTLLTRRSDLANIKFQPVKSQQFFVSDTFSQNIVECDVLSEPYNGFLREGRLYCVSSYWDGQQKRIEKSESFLKWQENLFRRVKKSLQRVDAWFYAGEHALCLRREGIKFNQLDGWACSATDPSSADITASSK